MKQKFTNSVISLMLVLAVFITSIPLATWTAIASTIVPDTLGAEDSSEGASLYSDSGVVVDYPTSSDQYTYVEKRDNLSTDYIPADLTADEFKRYCDSHMGLGVFDPVCYLQLNPDLKVLCTVSGNTITYELYNLYGHWIKHGIYEGRCASPFFCIGCYLNENADLLNAFKDSDNPYWAAWDHFNGILDTTESRVLSPIFHTQDYRDFHPDLKNASINTIRELLDHFMDYGANELRRASSRVDHIAYFYNNNSIFHSENGIQECYRKLMRELTPEKPIQNGTDVSINKESGCYYHKDVTYTGLAKLDDSFVGTLTNIATMKNISVNSDATAPTVVTPGNTKNELWQFDKQADGSYTIKLAPTDNSLTYENATETEKYLSVDINSNSLYAQISSTPMNWNIFKVDSMYVLRPQTEIGLGMYREVLNVSDDGIVSTTPFNAAKSTYNTETLNQCFVINTTYKTDADSDGLDADFYATIDAFTPTGMDTKVALTAGDKYLRTRPIVENGFPVADQIWHFMRQADGTYRILNTAYGKYLDSSETTVKLNNAFVDVTNPELEYSLCHINDYDGTNNSINQKWVVRKRDDGGYFIMPVRWQSFFAQGAYLNVANEKHTPTYEWVLYLDGFAGDEYEVFDIQPMDSQLYAYDLNGSVDDSEPFYAYISSAKSGYRNWYIKNSETQYGVVKQFEDTSGQDIKKHEFYWEFVRKGDGSYAIYSTTTVDGTLGYNSETGKVSLNQMLPDSTVAENNNWYIFKYNGGYRFQLKRTGAVLCMDENGNLSLEQANSNNYNDFQLFNIKETDMSINTAAETFKVNLFNYGSRINDPYDQEHVFGFMNGGNNGLDRRNVELSSSSGVVPEMSKVLHDNYPYVKKYAISAAQPDGSITAANGFTYNTPVLENMTPNVFKSGSLQYLFDPTLGFVSGGGSMTEYDPTAENGYDYQSQSFKVLNPSGLFQKDEDGYYHYNSRENSAYLDIDYSNKSSNGTLSGTFKVYDYLTHPIGVLPYGTIHFQGMFMPFNLSHKQGVLSYDKGTNESGKINYNQSVSGYPDINKASYTLPEITRNQDNTGESGDRTKAMDFWFGMSLETDFFQTKDGKLHGNDVTFEFSGDDDVWVYLDGILVLDLGNNPNVEKSVINFADSTVDVPEKTEYSNKFDSNRQVVFNDGSIGMAWVNYDTTNTCPTHKMSLYKAYYDAYEEVTDSAEKAEIEKLIRRSFGIAENEDLPQPVSVDADPKYADFEQHNLKFFYLERGAGASNCSIKLNTLSGGTTVSKEVTGLNEDIMNTTEYEFKAVSVDENGVETPIANSPYTVSSALATLSNDGVATISDLATDENGCFTLKANQKATFGQISPGSEFKVYELTEDSSITTSWKTYVYDAASSTKVETNGTGNVTDTLTVPTDSTIDVVFTNDYEPSQNITITKAFDETNTSDNYKPDTNQIYVMGYQLLNKEDEVVVTDTVTLHNGESAQIFDIPVGYKYRVWEYTPDGALNFEAPQFTVNNGKATTKTFVPDGATPGVNSYIEGIAKVNADDEIVVKNKLIKLGNITVTFKYYDRKRTSDGAPAQINDYYSTFTKELTAEEWEPYLNGVTQRINFSKLIADQGIIFDEKIAVDNLIDEYVIWTSQAEAIGENGLKSQKNFFAGKKDDGAYYTYGDVYSDNLDMLNYHTDAFGEICDCGEKWVTYYKGSNVIDPETQGNDTEVTAINVWLFNRPKQYELKLNTLSADELALATQNGDLLIGNNTVTFEAFYNQRVASSPETDNAEDDAFNSQVFWDAYKITDNDRVTGKDSFGNTVDYINLPETIVNDDDENTPYKFLYWSYDALGETIASTSIRYAYRITNNLELFAVYGKEEDETPGLTAFKNSIDTYIDANGNRKIRLNTMMNPYYCPDNDSTITDAAIVYVMLYGSDKYKNYSEAQLLKVLSETSSDGITTNLDKLREGIKTILAANKTSGKVTVVDVTVTASGFRYAVESSEGTTSKPNLTVKNRVQFTNEFSESTLKGKRMLAFVAMKKSDEWIVSDNYIDYDYLNNNIL